MKNKIEILLLAGGHGTRLFPLTLFMPKIFLKYRSRYLLDHHLTSLLKFRSNKIYINILSRGFYKRFIKKYFCNKKIEFIIEKKATGTAGILKKILQKKNKSDLIVIYSDTFHENDQEKIIKEVIKVSKGKNISISASTTLEKINDKGVVFIQKNNLNHFIEKPKKNYKSSFYFSGIVFIPNYLKNDILSLINYNSSNKEVLDFSRLVLTSRKFQIKVYKTDTEPLDFGKWTNVIKNFLKF
jgi:NDP-sugar pyrophosphorylase family protein